LHKIRLSKLTPDVEETAGCHQYGFGHNKATTDQTTFIHHILEKKWEYNFTVNIKVKVKLSLCLTKHHAMKAYWGSESIAPLIV
jgi:hypothetical protein